MFLRIHNPREFENVVDVPQSVFWVCCSAFPKLSNLRLNLLEVLAYLFLPIPEHSGGSAT